jgi:putative N6-adenine-specific DNA methylase
MAGRALQLPGHDARLPRPDFTQADFRDLQAPYSEGLLLCNPPYGERIGDQQQAEKLYRDMGCLFTTFSNWELGVITSQKNFEECIGSMASQQKSLKAGNLDTNFYIYNCSAKTGRHGQQG